MTDEKDLNEVLCTDNPVKIINNSGKDNGDQLQTKVYKRRWLMVGLFAMYSSMFTLQWVQYSIIANIVSRYYGVSLVAVDWTAMAFMGFYVIFAFPASYILDRWGLRWGNIIACGFGCLGSWIKVLSVSPDRFYVTFIGQSFVAVTQTIVLILPGRLAAQWFDTTEVSTATSLSIFGNQLGIAMNFFLTPMIVRNHENLDDIGNDLSRLFWGVAIVITIAFLLLIILFEDDPKLPPSKTRALQKLNKMQCDEGFIEPVKRLFKNKSYLLLCNSYGLGVGVLNVIGTLLNQLYLAHFENGEQDAGRIGLIMTITGTIGSVCFGIILDKTHKFKETTVIVYFFSLCGQILFSTFTCLEMKWMVFLSAVFMGCFMVGYLTIGYEMSAEYTYPESEGITAGILNVANNVYGIILVLLMGRVMEVYGDIPVHVGLCAMLLVGFIMTVFTKDEHRRQDAKNSQYVEDCSTASRSRQVLRDPRPESRSESADPRASLYRTSNVRFIAI